MLFKERSQTSKLLVAKAMPSCGKHCPPLAIIKVLPHNVYALEVDSPCDKNEEMWQKENDFPKGRRIIGFGLAVLTTGL